MTNPTPHGQVPEALRLAEQYDHSDPAAHGNAWKAAVCTELRRLAELEAQIEALSGVQALSAAPAVPNGDELRRIARSARTSASDDASPTEYVLAGWKAAMLAASHTPPAEQTFITPETGNSASAKGAAITSESGTPPAEQPAAQQGVVYAELPTRYYLVGGVEKAWDHQQMRDFADRTHALRMQAAPKAAPGVGNSGFDHQTAADFLSGKTVSDEAVRKFVAASRWAHDERAALSATLLAMHGVLTSREAEIALLKKALLEAEAAPQPAPDCHHRPHAMSAQP